MGKFILVFVLSISMMLGCGLAVAEEYNDDADGYSGNSDESYMDSDGELRDGLGDGEYMTSDGEVRDEIDSEDYMDSSGEVNER